VVAGLSLATQALSIHRIRAKPPNGSRSRPDLPIAFTRIETACGRRQAFGLLLPDRLMVAVKVQNDTKAVARGELS
jgi:hypothetical protein